MIKTKHELRPPFTTDEIKSMQEMTEGLIEQVTKYTGGENSQAIKDFANDMIDVLVDVKIDLDKFNPTERTDDGKSEAIH
tara:strand:- start:567 stop:806 length:240 start_codon:yes stop_codon:yes gene_type:complete